MTPAQQTPIARYIEEHANRSCYSYQEIALLCGFKTSDMIYAFIRGERKVPLDMIKPLAEILDCDRKQLFILALRTWCNEEFFSQLEETFGTAQETEAERGWLAALREIYGGSVPEITAAMHRRIRVLAG